MQGRCQPPMCRKPLGCGTFRARHARNAALSARPAPVGATRMDVVRHPHLTFVTMLLVSTSMFRRLPLNSIVVASPGLSVRAVSAPAAERACSMMSAEADLPTMLRAASALQAVAELLVVLVVVVVDVGVGADVVLVVEVDAVPVASVVLADALASGVAESADAVSSVVAHAAIDS